MALSRCASEATVKSSQQQFHLLVGRTFASCLSWALCLDLNSLTDMGLVLDISLMPCGILGLPIVLKALFERPWFKQGWLQFQIVYR